MTVQSEWIKKRNSIIVQLYELDIPQTNIGRFFCLSPSRIHSIIMKTQCPAEPGIKFKGPRQPATRTCGPTTLQFQRTIQAFGQTEEVARWFQEGMSCREVTGSIARISKDCSIARISQSIKP